MAPRKSCFPKSGHSFGVMCRWSDVAAPVLRPAEKGGKSAGILENVLTDEGARHPWFRQLAEELPETYPTGL